MLSSNTRHLIIILVLSLCSNMYRCWDWQKRDTRCQGFCFNFLVGGGMVPPPKGGDSRGGTVVHRGGMARGAFTTFNN